MNMDLVPIKTSRWATLAIITAFISLLLSANSEDQFAGTADAPLRVLTYETTDSPGQAQAPNLFRKRTDKDGTVSVEYGFVTMRNDQLQLAFSITEKQYETYRQGFGYRQQELDDLFNNQLQLLTEAHKVALKTRPAPPKLQETYARIKEDYQNRRQELLHIRGFRFLSGSVLTADIPAIVRNNVAPLNPVAVSLAASVNRLGYGPIDIIGAALSLVQTAIVYAELPLEVDGRVTAGYSPPMEVFIEGRGDCDAKSGLLASILLNWDKVRIIGVGIPGHYLLGVLQHPARGDAFIEYEGMNYVLVEPAGPAWLPPGTISDYSQKWLEAQEQIDIEAITIN